MIRINLLPVRAFRKKENIRKQVSIYLLTVVFLVAVFGFLYVRKHNSVVELIDIKETLAEQEIQMRKKVKEVDRLKSEEEDLQEKLKIIAKLETKRTGPVRILDEISRRTPANRAWLVNMTKAGDQLTLKGVAMDNETIALYMSNLEGSEYIQNVELLRSSQEIRNNMRLKSFSITCRIVLVKEELGEEGEAGQTAKAK